MEVQLSVALVTRNRPDSLRRTLSSLSKQVSPYEVLISDDSDNAEAIVENKRLAERFGCKYMSGPHKGLYANRNFVAKHCTGTHIRTMDDDHEFPEDHIKTCLEAIKQDFNVIWTIGEYIPTEINMDQPAPIPGQLHPRGYSYLPKDMNDYYGISCGATIYPRKVIDDNILNFEIFKFGIVYLEYGARLFNKKFVIKPLLSTFIIHHYDADNRSVSSMQIISSARIFSMLMLSFYHRRSLRNQFLTVSEILKGLFKKEYSFKIVYRAYFFYKKNVGALK